MNNYFAGVDTNIIEYFKILAGWEIPTRLAEYVNTKEVLRQQHISLTCGTFYSDLFNAKTFYSNLDHSIWVALIIRNFTHDKKQTLSWLFHDIATPAFKHCVDFFNWDHETQESTEELTTQIIHNSKEITNLLKRDWILEDEVNDYQIYPIADNKSPQLSADRFEYTFANAIFTYGFLSLSDMPKIYNDVFVWKDENNVDELTFSTLEYAKQFVNFMCKNSIIYIMDKTRYSMQFIAEMIKYLHGEWLLNKEDLYSLKEKEIFDILENTEMKENFHKRKEAKEVIVSDYKPEGVFYINLKSKIRYINPLVNWKRIYDIDKESRKLIDDVKNYDMSKYVYIPWIVLPE